MKFTSKQHEENFLNLMIHDNTRVSDKERSALWYIISGNQELYSRIHRIYNFTEHTIKRSINGGFSSSGTSLLILGFNLYNSTYGVKKHTISRLFDNLDSTNLNLALDAIKLRFGEDGIELSYHD